jgi:hypothetical protein
MELIRTFRWLRTQFEAAGDKRKFLYARWGAIRAVLDAEPITKFSYQLGQELAANPLLKIRYKELR